MSTSTTGDAQQFLTRFGLVALGVVVGAALLFVAIDAVGGSEPADEPAPGAGGATATPTTTASATPTGGATDQATDDGSAEVVTPSATATPTATPTTEEPVAGIAPEEISIQVLDGIRDGSDTARSIADDLEADGHELIAFGNSSRNYDQTTVFYSEGQEDAGRQVAAGNDWEIVRPASEVGLSPTVDVHVVVGTDAG